VVACLSQRRFRTVEIAVRLTPAWLFVFARDTQAQQAGYLDNGFGYLPTGWIFEGPIAWPAGSRTMFAAPETT